MNKSITLYTLGHSDLGITAFIGLLQQYQIQSLVDIRSNPHSTRHPQFNQSSIRQTLNQHGVQYHWAGRQFGGQREVGPHSIHIALPESLRGIAEHMYTNEFAIAVQQLHRMCGMGTTAIMCAEKQASHCHRRLIADYLCLQGIEVTHLQPDLPPQPHSLSPEARRESTELIYDRGVTLDLFNLDSAVDRFIK